MGGANCPFPRPEKPIHEIEYLVFSVGSIRGLAFIDAYDELLRHRPETRQNLRGLAGSSAGALMCLAIALRLSREEMLRFFREKQWFLITPWRVQMSCGALSLIDTTLLRAAMHEMFVSKNLDPKVTFSQFMKRIPLDLRIMTYNRSAQQGQVFSATTTPQAPVLDAVLASCSMPILMPPVWIQGACYVDGYLADSLPLLDFPRDKTLGFFLQDLRSTPPRPGYHVICICVARLSFLEFNPGPELRSWVLQQGREAVDAYFSVSRKTTEITDTTETHAKNT